MEFVKAGSRHGNLHSRRQSLLGGAHLLMPPLYFFLLNKPLSSFQDRAAAQQQLWMVEDTLAGLGGPQKQPPHTEPKSPSPAPQGEESSEREVRFPAPPQVPVSPVLTQ